MQGKPTVSGGGWMKLQELVGTYYLTEAQLRELIRKEQVPALRISSRTILMRFEDVCDWVADNPSFDEAVRLSGLRPDMAEDLVEAGMLPLAEVKGRRFVPACDVSVWRGYLDRCRSWQTPWITDNTAGFVYFLEAEGTGLVKIGWSTRPDAKRAIDLDVGSPVPLRLLAVKPGGGKEERVLHERFFLGRRRREWFDKRTPGLAKEIAACRRLYGRPRGLRLPSNFRVSGVLVAEGG